MQTSDEIDPRTVKAGDTVTVRNSLNATVTDKVTRVSGGGYWHLDLETYPATVIVGKGYWTLTAHQPAPEPEPEWEPGTTGTATVDGTEGVRGTWGALHDGELYFMIHDSRPVGRLSSTRKYVSGFVPDEPRPLPTREQIAVAIARADSRSSQSNLYLKNADAVLALLRGESR